MKKNIFCFLGVILLCLGSYSVIAGNINKNPDIKGVVDIVESSGYKDIREVEREYHHWSIDAKNAEGENVEIKMDLAGKIIRVDKDD
jgi:hypothetical protein